jgi:hypothetical protein
MKHWLRSSVAGIAALCLAVAPAAAQNTFSTTGTPQGPKVGGEVVMCINASSYAVPCSSGTPLPISGTITASLGGFTPSTSGARMTQLAVTTADSSGNLPTGAVAVISNTGTTNPMYCNVNGVAATTSDQLIPISSWYAFTVPSGVTMLHCIATGGSTTANGVGGAGLATGAGGGGGGGSGSNASVGATASGVPGSATYIGVNVGGNLTGLVGTANGLKVDGSAVTQPASLNATPTIANGNGVVPTQGGNALSATNGGYTNILQSNAVLATGNPLFVQLTAGSAIAAKVGIDQSTVGTTNGVSLAQIGANTVSTGAGATGTGSQRMGVAQDTTTIAGSAPGTAGTPSANVLSIQGVTSMTPLLVNPGTAANWGVAADNAAWTAGTTLQVPLGCEYTSGGATALTTGHVGTPGCTSARAQFTDKSSVSGTALGAAVSNLGTLASGTPAVENVNAYIVGGAGSGGTALTDNAAWTAGTTSFTPSGCEYTSGGATAITTAHAGTVGCTTGRAFLTDKTSVGGTALTAAVSAYGTAPTGTEVEGVNAYVTNTNANGQTTASASSPVVLASNQTAADPCMFQAKAFADFESTTSGGSVITAVSGKKAYICGVTIGTSTAANISLIEGTGSSVCTGGTTAGVYLNSGVTAANGMSFAATGGVAFGNGGNEIAANATANQNICVAFTTTNSPQVNVHVAYVQQ